MRQNLQNAIKDYCIMLPYLNTSSNPNDDTRLVKIAYEYVLIDRGGLDVSDFKSYMRLNNSIKDTDENDLDEFISNRIELILEFSYPMTILKNLSLLK